MLRHSGIRIFACFGFSPHREGSTACSTRNVLLNRCRGKAMATSQETELYSLGPCCKFYDFKTGVGAQEQRYQ